jgi:hypothetical protein
MRWQVLVLVLGMITAVDLPSRTLVLDTRNGPQSLVLPPSAGIVGERGEALTLGDLGPGDAVSYDAEASTLRVARQFWAIPAAR